MSYKSANVFCNISNNFFITFTLLNKQKWMYLVINLRGEETFSSTTPPLTMYSLIHLDPWWCIRQYMLTPDNVLCIEFLTCEKSNTQIFFFTRLSRKCFLIIKILYLYMECFIDPSIARIMIIEVQIFKKNLRSEFI